MIRVHLSDEQHKMTIISPALHLHRWVIEAVGLAPIFGRLKLAGSLNGTSRQDDEINRTT